MRRGFAVAAITAWIVLSAYQAAASEPTIAELQAEIRDAKKDADWAFKLCIAIVPFGALVIGAVGAFKIAEHFGGFNKAVQTLTAKVDAQLDAWQKDADAAKAELRKTVAEARDTLGKLNNEEIGRLSDTIDAVDAACRDYGNRLDELESRLATLSTTLHERITSEVRALNQKASDDTNAAFEAARAKMAEIVALGACTSRRLARPSGARLTTSPAADNSKPSP